MTPQTSITPVIFLAFANPRNDLNNLADEHSAIRAVLDKAAREGMCEIVERFNLDVSSLINVFQDKKYANRIAVFHFGGHAGDFELILNRSQVEGHSFNKFLLKHPALQLVFLNGCSTFEQAADLLQAGIPAIISTLDSIPDNIAKEFAVRFYNGLAEGQSIESAFEQARLAITSNTVNNIELTRTLAIPGRSEVPREALWQLKTTDEDTGKWKLEDEIGNPYFGLPKPGNYFLPPAPYISLKPYTEQECPIFWGRGMEIRELYLRITDKDANPVILLYGQTGVGKSSLLDAGLLPRLKTVANVFYARRLPDQGLTKTLQGVLNESEKETVIIVDQIEEAFTKPIKELPTELNDFIALVNSIVRSRTQIKLVLGYRKEYHAEIEAACMNSNLPFSSYFLQPLNRENVIEVVNGSNLSAAARNQYDIAVEEGLGEQLADDLCKDPDSPVAPVLQILLTKLWEKSVNEYTHKRVFSKELYNELKDKGIALSDFVNEKIREFERWNLDVVESGLLFDLLHFHTTPLGTSATNELSRIHERYDNADQVDKIILKCKECYLLVDTKGTKKQISLTHDTLAPVIRLLFDNSLKPGQKANRILVNQEMYLHDGSPVVPLNERDLSTLEQGMKGMRKLNEDEKKLVVFSKEVRKQKERQRKVANAFLKVAAAAVVVSLVVAVFLYYRSVNQGNRSKALYLASEAAKVQQYDQTQALRMLIAANNLSPDIDGVLQDIYKLYYNSAKYPFYQRDMYTDLLAPTFELSPDKGHLLLFNTAGSGEYMTKALIMNVKGGVPDTIYYDGQDIEKTTFLPQSKKIITLFRNYSKAEGVASEFLSFITINDYRGKVLHKFESKDQITNFCISKDERVFITSQTEYGGNNLNDTYLVVRSLNDGRENKRYKVGNGAEDFCWHPIDNKILFTTGDSVICLDLANETRIAKGLQRCYDINFSPDGKYFIGSSEEEYKAVLWTIDGELVAELYHNVPVNSAIFPRNDLIITSGEGALKVWTIEGARIRNIDAELGAGPSFLNNELNRIFIPSLRKKGLGVYDSLANEIAVMETAMHVWKACLLHNDTLIATIANHIRFWNVKPEKTGLPLGRWYWEKDDVLFGISGRKLIADNENFKETIIPASDRIINIVRGKEDSIIIIAINRTTEPSLMTRFDIPDTIRMYFIHNNGVGRILEIPGFMITSVERNASRDEFLAVCSDGKARLFDANGRIKRTLIGKIPYKGLTDYISKAEFSKSGKGFTTYTNVGYIIKWSENGDSLETFDFAVVKEDLPDLLKMVKYDISFSSSADGKKISMVREGTFCVIYDVQSKRTDTVYYNKEDDINFRTQGGRLIENGRYLIIQSSEGLDLWNLATKEMFMRIKCDPSDFDISPDENKIIINQNNGAPMIYLLPKGIRQWIKSPEIAPLSKENKAKYELN